MAITINPYMNGTPETNGVSLTATPGVDENGVPTAGAQPVAGATPVASTAATPATSTGTATAPGIGGVTGVSPAGIQSFAATPQVAPTYATAATVNPQQSQQYLDQYEGVVQSALAPTFAQQDEDLQTSLAARGISSSGAAAQLQTQLQGQQAAAVASADEPLISAEAGYSQADIAANQANEQAVNTGNAGASNTADLANAELQQGDITDNFQAYNNYVNELFGAGVNDQSALETAYLNSYGPSTGVESGYTESLGGEDTVFGSTYGSATQAGNSALSTGASLFGDALMAGAV
jgi:hypothetical protein